MVFTSQTRLWLALFPALTLPFFASLIYFSGAFDPEISRWGYGFSKAFTLVWPVICLLWIIGWRNAADTASLAWRPATGLPETSGERSSPFSFFNSVALQKVFSSNAPLASAFHWFLIWREGPSQEKTPVRPVASLIGGTILGIVIVAFMLTLMETPLGALVKADAPQVLSKIRHLGFEQHYLLAAILISVAHSALEEYYWRWFAYGSLRRMLAGPWPHVIAALGFSLHHYVLLWFYFTPWLALLLGTAVGVGGLLWSLLYQKTGTLLGSWVSHVLVDFGIFWVGWQLMNLP